MTLESVKLKILKYLFKINVKIGRRLAFYISGYNASREVGDAVKKQKFDLRGMKERMKAVTIHDQDIIDKRWDICKSCEFLTEKNMCQKCGCFMKVKTRIATVACPIDKRGKEYNFMEGRATNGTQPVVK